MMRFTIHARRAVAAGCLTSLIACGGTAPADTAATNATPSAAATAAPEAATAVSNELGEAIYARNCTTCHMPNGAGVPGAFPPLAGSEWVTGSVDKPIAIVLHGLQGPITVSGKQFSAVMVANGIDGPLSDEEIASVLSYVRSSWGNSASAVTPADVARVRASTIGRTSPWTAAELELLP